MRLFLAFPPVPSWQQAQNELMSQFADTRIRWTRPQNLHLTLYFIGEADPGQFDRLCASAAEVLSNASSFNLDFESIVTSGVREHPTMLWLRYTVHPAFTELHHRLHQALGSISISRGGVHALPVPHVTLARFPKNTPEFQTFRLTGSQIEKLSVDVCELWQTTHDDEGVLYKRLNHFRIGS